MYPVADLDAIVPADSKKSFDMKEVIARITDGSEFREFKAEYGKTIITVSGIATFDCSSIRAHVYRALPRYMVIRE